MKGQPASQELLAVSAECLEQDEREVEQLANSCTCFLMQLNTKTLNQHVVVSQNKGTPI